MGSHTLVFHLLGTSKKLQKALGNISYPIPLSFSQARTLLVIESKDDTSQHEIAQKLQLEPASIVTLIDELEKLNLVTRTKPKNNRRKYHIQLTKEGEKIAKITRKQALELEKFIESKLKANNKNALFNFLSDLDGILDNWQLQKRREVK